MSDLFAAPSPIRTHNCAVYVVDEAVRDRMVEEMDDNWAKKLMSWPSTFYVFTYDDGTAHTLVQENTNRRMQTYKTFDELAKCLAGLTDRNLYSLRANEDCDVWQYWEDNHITVRYDLTTYPKKQRDKIVSDDRWMKYSGLMMKDHYSNDLPIFDSALG